VNFITNIFIHIKLVNFSGVNEISFVDQISGEIFVLIYNEAESDLENTIFEVEIPRNIERSLKLDISNYEFPNCFSSEYAECDFEQEIYLPKLDFSQPWTIWCANIFSPNGDGENDYFLFHNARILSNSQNNPCDMSFYFDNSSIHFFRLLIWNRLGELIFEQELEISPYATEGLDISSVKWDGTYNGEKLTTDSFDWGVEIHSCYQGTFNYGTCENLSSENGYYSNNEVISQFSGNVTLLR
jgi:hypothetical protein